MSIYFDLYRYRELFGNLFRRDLQTRYKGSALGVLWSLINPLVLISIYVLVFSLLWKVAHDGALRAVPARRADVIALLLTSLTTASRSLLDSAALIRKVRLPRQLVQMSMVATSSSPSWRYSPFWSSST